MELTHAAKAPVIIDVFARDTAGVLENQAETAFNEDGGPAGDRRQGCGTPIPLSSAHNSADTGFRTSFGRQLPQG